MSELIAAQRVVPGAATWSAVLHRGDALEVEDLEGGANAALLLVDAHRPTERLNVPDTLKASTSRGSPPASRCTRTWAACSPR